MKKLFYSLFLLCLLTLAISLTVNAETISGTCGATEEDSVFWNFEPETATLTISGTGKMESYSYNGSLPNTPWKDYIPEIKNLIIEKGVTKIGSAAFLEFKELCKADIGDTVVSIGDRAFFSCNKLSSIHIPSSLRSVGDYAFECWMNTERSVYIDDVKSWCEIRYGNCNSAPFYHVSEGKLYLNGELLTEVAIPETVTAIPDCAFQNCSSIETVWIPDSVTSIGECGFANCTNLTSVRLPSGLSQINYRTFWECQNLSDITIPEGVTTIGEGAFYGCVNLTDITIPTSVNVIEYSAFSKTGIIGIKIPSNVTKIGVDAFSNCDNLAFVDIDSLSDWCKMDGHGGILSNGAILYVQGEKAVDIVIPDGLTDFGSAFSGYVGLQSITIPTGITSIGNDAFKGCSNLKSIVIPDSVKTIGTGAFSYCDKLQDVTLPQSITQIPSKLFYFSKGLKHIVIPEGVTSIEVNAFAYCDALTSVTLPRSLKKVNTYAFYWCSRLNRINITDISTLTNVKYTDQAANPLFWAHKLYFNDTPIEQIVIPQGITMLQAYACTGADVNSLVIPKTLKTISKGAFSDCKNITDIYYEGTEAEWSNVRIAAENDILAQATVHTDIDFPSLDAFSVKIHSLSASDQSKINNIPQGNFYADITISRPFDKGCLLLLIAYDEADAMVEANMQEIKPREAVSTVQCALANRENNIYTLKVIPLTNIYQMQPCCASAYYQRNTNAEE